MNKQKLLLVLSLVAAVALGISAFFIGKTMSSDPAQAPMDHSLHQQTKKETVWTCAMHPQIKLKKPGKCPICGMDLIPLKTDGMVGKRQIKLSPLAQQLASVEVMPVIRKEFYFSIPMVGKISLDETRSKKITSRYAGRLDRLFVDYTGIQVKKGEHLFEIYSPQLITAQEELLQSIVSAKTMKNSSIKAIRESSAKAVQASRDKLILWGLTDKQIKDFEKTKIVTDDVISYSPMEGIVVKKHVDEGSYVKEGSVIYSIANMNYLWVELDAYESDLQWLHYAQNVVFTTEALPGEEFSGRISFIHPVLNNKTRTVKVRVNVDNKDRRLKPSMFVRAQVRVNVNAAGKVIDVALAGKWISPMHPEIIRDKPGPCPVCSMPLVRAEEYGFTVRKKDMENPLLIPSSAPLITGKRSVVYIKSAQSEGIYEGRVVTLGLKAGDYYIVKEGLKEGDLVVVKGAFKIDSALQIQAKPSMMSESSVTAVKKYDVGLKFKTALSQIYNVYDSISQGLSKDSITALPANVDLLVKALAAVDESKESRQAAEHWRTVSRQLELAALSLKSAKALKDSRGKFEKLSKLMIGLVRSYGTREKINLAYCPMAFNDKGAFWLQKSDKVENPYFGSQMFGCGNIKQVFASAVNSAKVPDKPVVVEKPGKPVVVEKLGKPVVVDDPDKKPAVIDDPHKGHKMQAPVENKPKFPDKSLAVYLQIHKALSQDHFPESGKDILLKGLTELKMDKKALAAVNQLYSSKKIKEVRGHFKTLSDYLIKVGNSGQLSRGLNLLFCHMAFNGKGGFWLQTGDNIENPYYGSRMYRCGEIKKKLAGDK